MKNGKHFISVSNRSGRIIEMSREDFEKYGQKLGMKTINTASTIKYDTPVNEGVEIIVILYNNPEVEKKCVEEVKKHTKHPYKLTLFDNYKEKLSLSDAWNKCIKKSKSKYICLLNNDAFVTNGWLEEMMKGFNDEDVVAVGSSGDNVGGIQGRKTEEFSRKNMGNFQQIDFISGYCMLIKRVDWEFPSEVPFYGNEHAWMVEAYRRGRKTLWARGSYVYHLGEATGKKEGTNLKLRENGIKQYSKWCASTSPVLMITHNRLEFTKKSLKALKGSNVGKIYIIDNASTDGTVEWLKKQKGIELILNKENKAIAGTMNQFLEMTDGEEFVGKVDNDTVVEPDWLEKLIMHARINNLDIIQAKHHIFHNSYDSWNEWMSHLTNKNKIYLSQYVGGSGVAINRRTVTPEIPLTSWALGGWTQYQTEHPELRKAFTNEVEVELLDMEGDNEPRYGDYPEYYKMVKRAKIRSKNVKQTIGEIFSRLGKRFAYLRFGDGELLMFTDDFGGHPHTQWTSPEIVKELEESFTINHPDYLIGCIAGMPVEPKSKEGLFAPFKNNDEMLEMVKKYYTDKTFYTPIPFHYLYKLERNTFNQLIEILKKYKVAFVGGKHLTEVMRYGFNEFIEIPSEQAYDTIDEWYPEVKEAAKRNEVMLICAAMTANVIQKRLWEDRIKIGTIDLGSVANAITNYSGDRHSWIKK